LSRKSYPKQFVELVGDQTLFQSSAKRLTGGKDGLSFEDPIVITNSDFRFIVTEQLMGVGMDPSAILIEPEGRNTAPAVLVAALHIAKTDPDALMLVLPSDHVVPDTDAFHACIQDALPAVAQGDLVTFGITPDTPETGYGYLELASSPEDTAGPIKLTRFVEKPALELAKSMLAQGNFLWNAGIFLFAV
jgi:mannose-1-phosphate guanylyltransferase/mannose-6-phosphate isomerase